MSRLWINPIHVVVPPILLLISIPLAAFAGATTIIALLTLILRALVVYFDVGIALVQSWISIEFYSKHGGTPIKSKSPRTPRSPRSPGSLNSNSVHSISSSNGSVTVRARRGSNRSLSSMQSFDGALEPGHTGHSSGVSPKPSRSESYASLIGVGAPDRDYEGVGGWRDFRVGVRDEEVAEDDARWMNMNSRLVLPVGGITPTSTTTVPVGTLGGRPLRHKRSLTGSGQRLNFKISPMQSRARTPSAGEEDMGYFTQRPNMARRRSLGIAMTGFDKKLSNSAISG